MSTQRDPEITRLAEHVAEFEAMRRRLAELEQKLTREVARAIHAEQIAAWWKTEATLRMAERDRALAAGAGAHAILSALETTIINGRQNLQAELHAARDKSQDGTADDGQTVPAFLTNGRKPTAEEEERKAEIERQIADNAARIRAAATEVEGELRKAQKKGDADAHTF